MPVCGASFVPWLPPRPPSLAELLEPLAEEPPAEAPDESSVFFAFLAFLTFFVAFGFSSVAALLASVPEAPELAAGEDELPLVALGLVDDEPELPLMPLELPDAPLPVVPEAPDELSLGDVLLPAAPDEDMPLLPEEPDVLPEGMALELPLVPGLVCELDVADGDESLVPLVELLCASAMEDTDATTTNDSERRVVFNVISNSLLLNERHQRCCRLDASLARAFSPSQFDQLARPLIF